MAGRMRKSMRLSVRLVLLIALCWILPLTLTLFASGMISARATRNRVADLVTASAENTAGLVKRDLDQAVNDLLSVSYEPAIRKAYITYQASGNRTELINAAHAYLQQKFSRNELLNAVYVVFPDAGSTQTYNRGRVSFNEAISFYGSALYKNTDHYVQRLDSNVEYVYESGRLYLVRLLTLRASSFSPYALLVADLNLDGILAGLHNMPWVTDVTLRVGDYYLPVLGDIPLWHGGGGFLLENNALTTAASLPAGRFGFSYRVAADLTEPLNEMSAGTLLLQVIAVFSAALMGFVFYFFARRVNRPIALLSALAKRIEQGELGAQCTVDHMQSAEFMYLGTRMNEMSAQLRDQFERLYREELALRDARIAALQSQIDPHFLGNTLEIINWEARLAGDVKASQMLEALSTLLHAAQDRKKHALVHLSEEMMYVNAYLFITGARLGKRLEVVKEIDERLLDRFVPRLILQPILENAVEHGVGRRPRGTITIRAEYIDEDWMRLSVENDNPMAKEDEARVRALLGADPPSSDGRGNIGIRNVNKRLLLLYGERGALTVETVGGASTLAAMCIQRKEYTQENAT